LNPAFVEPHPAESLLGKILASTAAELAASQTSHPIRELERQIADLPPAQPFTGVLREAGFSVIAELKRRSPSQGHMPHFDTALDAYERSPIVSALSVLTNRAWFDTGIDDLRMIRAKTGKPILRKEFIVDPHQVFEARAAGADAVLLMANVLTPVGLAQLSDVACELGLTVLFEVHTAEEIAKLPSRVDCCGVNSRTFSSNAAQRYAEARAARDEGHARDLSTDLGRFDLVAALPQGAVRIAESGITPGTIAAVRDQWRFDAALIGTSLLTAPEGPAAALAAFERALG
jgi:indole-3-glycerol phosphate synthase